MPEQAYTTPGTEIERLEFEIARRAARVTAEVVGEELPSALAEFQALKDELAWLRAWAAAWPALLAARPGLVVEARFPDAPD